MRWTLVTLILLSASACGIAPQPESAKTVAAFEVPLPSRADRNEFLAILRSVAKQERMHVDASSEEELERQAHVSSAFRKTLHAAVWKGAGDDEVIASAMDLPDNLGNIWITFFKGEDEAVNGRFRDATMREIMQRWPGTLSLPIMPTGAIPLPRDLVRTPEGYVVNPAESHRYELHNEAVQSQFGDTPP